MKETTKSSNESTKNIEWKAEQSIAYNFEALHALRELIAFPLLYSFHAQLLGLKWRRGLLLYGPPGTGKVAICPCSGCSPHTVHRAHVGESKKVLREAVSDASSHAKSGKPSVIFFDEIDAFCPRRTFSEEVLRRK